MEFSIKIKKIIFRIYMPLLILLMILISAWFLGYSRRENYELTIYLTLMGGLISFFYFIQKHQLDELNLFKELFTEFNIRYDRMNENLNELVSRKPNKLEDKDKDLLNNYFNLCSEEYLYYKKGYIYEEVWKAWRNGMQSFFNIEVIKKYWLDEEKSNSYYGLTYKIISIKN